MNPNDRGDARDVKHEPDSDANRDPLTGEPGSHPVGTGLGAAGGAAAGAAIGAVVGGPVGAVLGGAIGAVGGGMGGHAAGEAVNPTAEDEYWRSNWRDRPYADRNQGYEHYQPAYRFGWESRARYRDREWGEVESDLATDWSRHRDRERTPLKWDEARLAARDAWHRLERTLPGDADRDGR